MVLIIDDDQSVRVLTERLVKTLGFGCMVAVDGAQGISIFEANAEKVSVVVLDLTMPDLNGEETFIRLRKVRPNLPIIFTSGYEKGDEVLHDANTGFLQKPFRRDDLRDKLTRFAAKPAAAS